MYIKTELKKIDDTTELTQGKYIFHFKSYILFGIDIVENGLRLFQNREFSVFGWKIKSYSYETYQKNSEKRYKIRIDIVKATSEQQTTVAPITIALIISLIGLGIAAYLVLDKVEKIIAEIPTGIMAGLIVFGIYMAVKQ